MSNSGRKQVDVGDDNDRIKKYFVYKFLKTLIKS